MNRKDLLLAAVIGGAVGLLVQPILLNIHGLEYISAYVPLGINSLRFLVFAFFLVLAPVALLVAGWIGKFSPGIYQFAKFAAVGTLNSFLDIGVLNLEALMLHQNPQAVSTAVYFLLKSVSFLVATTNSYLWNKFWTFEDKSRSHSETVVIFYGITLVTYFLNTGVATFLKAHIGGSLWASLLAPVCGIAAAMFANFFSYKYLVFKKPEEVKPI